MIDVLLQTGQLPLMNLDYPGKPVSIDAQPPLTNGIQNVRKLRLQFPEAMTLVNPESLGKKAGNLIGFRRTQHILRYAQTS